MGVFNKIKDVLIEEVPCSDVDLERDIDALLNAHGGSDVEVNLDGVDSNSLITGIYENNSLSEMQSSIFKVEELIKSLPDTMATETKKQSVIAILTSFGLTASELISDGTTRLEVLNSANTAISERGKEVISNAESEIESHKLAIAESEEVIANEKENMKSSAEQIYAETERISNLVKFIGG